VGTGGALKNEIYGVFVAPEAQGKGCGKKIMQTLEKHIQKSGYSNIELSISLPSREFYEDMGYQIVEEVHRDLGQGETLIFWKGLKEIANT